MDLNKIWDKFGNFDSHHEDEIKTEIERLKSSPYYKIKSFEKYLNYYDVFMKDIYGFIEGGEADKIRQAGMYLYINSAFSYISNCDFSKSWILEIESVSSKRFLERLSLCIKMFEFYEEYEKCHILKKISDICLKKLGFIEKP